MLNNVSLYFRKMDKENYDPDPEWKYYDRDKSHNSSFYGKTPGVCTNTNMELRQILRTTNEKQDVQKNVSVRNQSSESYWISPRKILLGGCESQGKLNHGEPRQGVAGMCGTHDEVDEASAMDYCSELPGQEGYVNDLVHLGGAGLEGRRRKNRKRKKRKKAGNLSRYSEREIQREIERNQKILNEKVRIENLKSCLGNPWDDVSFDEKKKFALHFYYTHLQEHSGACSKVKGPSRDHAAGLVGVSSRTIGQWALDFETTTYIQESKRGRHSKTKTPINDESFCLEFKAHVKENTRKRGEANLTAAELVKWVNARLNLEGQDCYSERTVVNWLHATGFKVTESRKGIYFDGHERPDVVEDRARFIKEYEEYYQDAVKVDPTTLDITDKDKKYLLISQDEKIHHSNDVQARHWDDGNMNFPPSKSQGRTVMTSDFVEPIGGFLEYSEEVWSDMINSEDVQNQILASGGGRKGECRARRAGKILDVRVDGYYDSSSCTPDFVKAVKVSKANYPLLIPVIVTDWSPIHGSFGSDALNAAKMNVGIGGKQPIMKDGYYSNSEGDIVSQSMVFKEGPHIGKAKGLKQVCTERFGAEKIRGKRQDDLVKLLEKETDFLNQKPLIVEACEAAGGKVLFGTKFHPELMTIENVYRDISAFMKRRNIVGSSVGYVERICDSYGSVDIKNIRKYFLSVLKFMSLYRSGETGDSVFLAMTKQRKKHREGMMFGQVDHSKKSYKRKRNFSI